MFHLFKPFCRHCQSHEIRKQETSHWDFELQQWVISGEVLVYCLECRSTLKEEYLIVDDADKNFPILVELPDGRRVVFDSPFDIPPGAILKVIETNYSGDSSETPETPVA